eukprot:2454056-Amphidinium_carterae.1
MKKFARSAFNNARKWNKRDPPPGKFCVHRAMPGLVTILCHAECFGAWTSFWAPCRGTLPFSSKVMTEIPHGDMHELLNYQFDTVSRRDICSWRWQVNHKDCMDATIENLGWLLYFKFAHSTFTIAALRVAKARFVGNGMSLESSHALLQFSWLVVTLFGPCLPILNTLIVLFANIYSFLLFGSHSGILVLKETDENTASLPSLSFSMVALLTLAFHSTNLL